MPVARNRAKIKVGLLDLQRRADALGVSKSHLSRVIQGKRESRSLLDRLAQMEAYADASEAANPAPTTTPTEIKE